MPQAIEWRAVKDWPYEVSNAGEVRRIGGRILRPMWTSRKSGGGYATVRLCCAPRQTDRRLHHLVLEAFVGPRPAGLLACHRDDDKKNNALWNLYWGTHSQNTADRCRKHNFLSPQQISDIRERRALGEKGAVLAREYSVSQQLVCDIIKGRRYSLMAH